LLFDAYKGTSRNSAALFMMLDTDKDGLLQPSEVENFLDNLSDHHMHSINDVAIKALKGKSERVRRESKSESLCWPRDLVGSLFLALFDPFLKIWLDICYFILPTHPYAANLHLRTA